MTAATLILFSGDVAHWLRVEDGVVAVRGTGWENAAIEPDMRIVGVVPARDTAIHQLRLTGVTDAQARGAARLAVADLTLAPIDTMHVAVGAEDDGERTVVAIDRLALETSMAEFMAYGLEPHALIAAALIAPRPKMGFVRADLGNETVIRGRDTAFVDDPVLTPLLADDEIVRLDRQAIEVAILAHAMVPEVDIRQGMFARRRRWTIDRQRRRRIVWLAAACLATVLLVPLATLIHLGNSAQAIETKNVVEAQSALPPGTAILNPVAQLDERLAVVGDPGGGFLSIAGAVGAAANAIPDVELGAMSFDTDTGFRVTARAANPASLAAFEARLGASGLIVAPSPIVPGLGRSSRDYGVRVR